MCSSNGLPTLDRRTSSGTTRPSTARVACRSESRISSTESTSVPSKSNNHVAGGSPPDIVTRVTPEKPIFGWEGTTAHEKPTPCGRRGRPHPRPRRLRQRVLLQRAVDHDGSGWRRRRDHLG